MRDLRKLAISGLTSGQSDDPHMLGILAGGEHFQWKSLLLDWQMALVRRFYSRPVAILEEK